MIIIYSGGMDSTTLLYQYREKIKLALFYKYGSVHNEKEIRFAEYHCKKLGIELIKIDLTEIFKHFESGLLETAENIPDGHYQELTMKKTVVPFRNGIFLSIAAGIAETRGYESILIANHVGDHAIYPDCRATFINAMSEAISYGTYSNNAIKIIAPFTYKTKRDIAIIGRGLNIDYSKTWSCYKGKEVHCGTCGTCVERKEALTNFDNTEYLK